LVGLRAAVHDKDENAVAVLALLADDVCCDYLICPVLHSSVAMKIQEPSLIKCSYLASSALMSEIARFETNVFVGPDCVILSPLLQSKNHSNYSGTISIYYVFSVVCKSHTYK
jgi:hypothetical protein